MKHDNINANIHMLTKEESKWFKAQIEKTNKEFTKIVEKNKLTGNWTISSDFKFLVKQGD